MAGETGALGTGSRSKAGDRHGTPDGAQWARPTPQTRATTIGGGTTGIQLSIIAERPLALPRDPEPPNPSPDHQHQSTVPAVPSRDATTVTRPYCRPGYRKAALL
jgi:hypothetical protein